MILCKVIPAIAIHKFATARQQSVAHAIEQKRKQIMSNS